MSKLLIKVGNMDINPQEVSHIGAVWYDKANSQAYCFTIYYKNGNNTICESSEEYEKAKKDRSGIVKRINKYLEAQEPVKEWVAIYHISLQKPVYIRLSEISYLSEFRVTKDMYSKILWNFEIHLKSGKEYIFENLAASDKEVEQIKALTYNAIRNYIESKLI